MKSKFVYHKFSGLYFTQFFGLGAFLPLLSIYLKNVGMSGSQIGTITAIGSLVTVFSAPLVGYIADRFHLHQKTYMALFAISALAAGLLPLGHNYLSLVILIFFFNLGQGGLTPILDSIALHVHVPFGRMRLWGAIGFGVASGLVGFLADQWGLEVIFYFYALSAVIAIVILSRIKVHLEASESLRIRDLGTLLGNKAFLLFLIYCFLVGATINGQNVYFGLLFEEIGGNITLIGIAFLLFTFSEAPFMHFGASWVQNNSITKILLIAPLILSLRWFYYGSIAGPTMILILFFVQGFAYIFFILGSAEYIKQTINTNLRSTAMALFTSFSFGLGGLFSNLLSGYVYDHYSGRAIYLSYGIICLIAFISALPLHYMKPRSIKKTV